MTATAMHLRANVHVAAVQTEASDVVPETVGR
jgi:hypothetical protein